MKYINKAFSVAVGAHSMTDLLYDLRVGKITQAEYKRLAKQQDRETQRDKHKDEATKKHPI